MQIARLKLAAGPAEAGIAMLSLGGSLVYWLGLAFVMPPTDYGRMMTIQAGVFVVVTIFTFRTHDLFFKLISQSRCPVGQAYRTTLRIELAAASAGALICAGGVLVLRPFGNGALGAAAVAFYALVASFGAINGASIGKLRYWMRGDIVARTDLMSAATWGAACISIPFVQGLPPIVPLIIGAAPIAVRTIALILSARDLSLRTKSPEACEDAAAISRRTVISFLAEAQVTNFLKNAGVSIETLILAAFAPPATVAMYRVARSAQGPATAAINVFYQRAFPALAQAPSPEKRRLALRRLRGNSLAACLAIFPLSALIAVGYSLLKPEIGIIQLQLITAGTWLALLPGALQQGPFAVLAIAGEHRAASLAYVYSFLFLGLTSLVLLVWPEVEIFMIGLIVGAFVRFWYLQARSRRAITGEATPRGLK